MSRSTWKIIEIDYKGKKKKYQLNDKGALKLPKNKNFIKSKRFTSANPKSNPPPHPFSVVFISNSSNSKDNDNDNDKSCQEKSKEKVDVPNINSEKKNTSFQDYILDFFNFDDIKDSKDQSEYEYSDETNFDCSGIF